MNKQAAWVPVDTKYPVKAVTQTVTRGSDTIVTRRLTATDVPVMITLWKSSGYSDAALSQLSATLTSPNSHIFAYGLFVNNVLDTTYTWIVPSSPDPDGDEVAAKIGMVSQSNARVMDNNYDSNQTLLTDFCYSELARIGIKAFYRAIDASKPDQMSNPSLKASTLWTATYIEDIQPNAKATGANADWLNQYVITYTTTSLRKLYKMKLK